jgi:hypothetical protein
MVLPLRPSPLRDLRLEVAEALGILRVAGKATSGGTGEMRDTNRLLFANASDLLGDWVYIHTGTGLGQERVITAFDPSLDRITPGPAFNTAPDSTSEYIVTRYFSAAQIDRAIDQALMRYSQLVHLPLEDHTLGVNNIFNDPHDISNYSATGRPLNWQFDTWATQHVPDDWSLTNVNSDEEEATILLPGSRRVLKLQNDGGTDATALINLVGVENRYVGRQVRAYGWVRALIANFARVEFGNGVGGANVSPYHSGNYSWERLDTGWQTVDAEALALRFVYRNDTDGAGGAIASTNYYGPAQMVADFDFQEYILSQGFSWVEEVQLEMTAEADYGLYSRPLPHDYWEIAPGGQLFQPVRATSVRGQDTTLHPRLIFRTDKFSPQTPARIRIRGRGLPQLIASTAVTLGGPASVGVAHYEDISPILAPELIRYAAAAALNERLPRTAQKVSTGWLLSEERRWARTYTTRAPSTGRRVR